tara:strand:- start:352 stop:765 length:414 start_codon:yes stop_codon:yes gene_type:complete
MEISFIPQFILNRITHNDILKIHYNILFSNILIMFFLLSGGISIVSKLPHFCLVDNIFHVPCPGCDITSGINKIMTLENLSLSPLFIIIAIVCQVPLRIIAILHNNYSKNIIKISKYINYYVILGILFLYIINIPKL